MRRDPLVTLASTLHATPGAYALLLGSGASRGAGLMTGWEIAVDLVRRLAVAEGVPEPADPVAWYRDEHGDDVDYSRLLELLAPGTGDRQSLLTPYFEPTEDEQEAGLKAPTAAHRAVAELVRRGFVRVIVTTNFDRLIERALQDAGLEPLVIASAADALRAPPLHLARCVVVKAHGDRLSPDLRNTLAELDEYPEPMSNLLRRVFDDYGLVICGWSTEWDPALRRLIAEHEPKIFTTFWAHRGDPTETASDLIKRRVAVPIAIQTADEFLDELAAKVAALDEASLIQVSDADMTVAELKRYLPRREHRLRLQDLVLGEVERAVTASDRDERSLQGSITYEEFGRRLEESLEDTASLTHLTAALGYYADEPRHDDLALRAFTRLAERKEAFGGLVVLLHLQRLPDLMALYALGVTSLSAGRPQVVGKILSQAKVRDSSDQRVGFAYRVNPVSVLEPDAIGHLPGLERRKTPSNDFVHDRLRAYVAPFIPDSEIYDGHFDDFEYLLGLAVMDETERWAPPGRFAWRREYPERGARDAVVSTHGDDLLESGLFGGSTERLSISHQKYEEFLDRNSHRYW
jgi:hypothetical protein